MEILRCEKMSILPVSSFYTGKKCPYCIFPHVSRPIKKDCPPIIFVLIKEFGKRKETCKTKSPCRKYRAILNKEIILRCQAPSFPLFTFLFNHHVGFIIKQGILQLFPGFWIHRHPKAALFFNPGLFACHFFLQTFFPITWLATHVHNSHY